MSRPKVSYDLGAGPPWQSLLSGEAMTHAAETIQMWLRAEHPQVLASLVSTVNHGGTISVKYFPQSKTRPAAFGYRCLGAVCNDGRTFDLYADTDPLDRIPEAHETSSPGPDSPAVPLAANPQGDQGVDGSGN